jgi:prophage maintenance system killer protein
MAKIRQLNIDAIRSCLVDTQKNFDKINSTLTVKRKPPSNEVIDNLIAGYSKINEHLHNHIDLFKIGNSELILELNHIVLYHHSAISLEEDKSQFKATIKHFYETKSAGIGPLMEWLEFNKNTSIWKKTAGTFTHIISQPQLFLEGNHRTGSLIMSYLLMREGLSPFVLSYDNAKHFFEPAELTKNRHKKTLLDEFLHLPKQTQKFAKLLKDEQSKKFLKK